MNKDTLGWAPDRDQVINYGRKKFYSTIPRAYTKNVLQS